MDSITIVSFQAEEQELKMMALELDSSIQIGTKVVLGAKATNTSLAKELKGLLSVSNQLPCRIESIEFGELLCSVKLGFSGETLESIITKDSAIRMNIQVEDEVLALIKSSELSIVEVL